MTIRKIKVYFESFPNSVRFYLNFTLLKPVLITRMEKLRGVHVLFRCSANNERHCLSTSVDDVMVEIIQTLAAKYRNCTDL